MLAQAFLLLAFYVDGQQSLEVLVEILEFHLVDHVDHAEVIFYHLVGVSQERAEELIVRRVAVLYLHQDIIKLLACFLLQPTHLVHSLIVVLGEAELIVVGILLVGKNAEVLAYRPLLRLLPLFADFFVDVEGLLVPGSPIE